MRLAGMLSPGLALCLGLAIAAVGAGPGRGGRHVGDLPRRRGGGRGDTVRRPVGRVAARRHRVARLRRARRGPHRRGHGGCRRDRDRPPDRHPLPRRPHGRRPPARGAAAHRDLHRPRHHRRRGRTTSRHLRAVRGAAGERPSTWWPRRATGCRSTASTSASSPRAGPSSTRRCRGREAPIRSATASRSTARTSRAATGTRRTTSRSARSSVSAGSAPSSWAT